MIFTTGPASAPVHVMRSGVAALWTMPVLMLLQVGSAACADAGASATAASATASPIMEFREGVCTERNSQHARSRVNRRDR